MGETLINNNSNRKSNFELLRIISMFLIVVFHFSDWGKIIEIESPKINKLFGEFINIFGNLGVNIFVLISGYFLVNSKFKFKKILKIIFEVWFYSVTITIVCHILKIGSFEKYTLIKSFFPISFNMYWFATSYAGLYLIFPILNKIINNVTKQGHKIIIILLGIMLSIIPAIIWNAKPFYNDLNWLIYMYIIAAYIRKYEIDFLNNNKKNILGIILVILVMFLASVFFTIFRNKVGFFQDMIKYFNEKNSIFTLVLSILVFMFFKNINIKNNKAINLIAKSCFGVYLIHINAVLREYLFSDIIKIGNFYQSNIFVLMSYTFIAAIIIYIICTIIDILRIKLIEEPIFKTKWIDKITSKVDKIMEI